MLFIPTALASSSHQPHEHHDVRDQQQTRSVLARPTPAWPRRGRPISAPRGDGCGGARPAGWPATNELQTIDEAEAELELLE